MPCLQVIFSVLGPVRCPTEFGMLCGRGNTGFNDSSSPSMKMLLHVLQYDNATTKASCGYS